MYEKPDLSEFADVGRFHGKFGLPISQDQPREVDPELLRFRLNFLLEELMELMDATGMVWEGHGVARIVFAEPGDEVDIDHPKAFDALLDLVYVAYGTAHLFGYPWGEGWREVQQANMAKVRAAKDGSDSKRGSSYDVVKPEGWSPPDIEKILQRNGWDINQ